MLARQNIFLIGPMGAGKTAVGRALARRLGWPFHDTDLEIQAATGVDIPYVFEKEGEEGFRRREREMLEHLTRLEPLVLATGGGVVLHPDNRKALAERGRVVYLETDVPQQLQRTRRSRTRPLLLDTDPQERLRELMRVREPLYREIADLTVDTNGRRVAAVVSEILRKLQGR